MTIEYQILREIEQNPSHTQRTLAQTLDISLGKANYVLAGLVEKGVVKARRLGQEPRAIRWRYILTPKGMREKWRLTSDYLARRVREYDHIRGEIEQLKRELATHDQ